ncbi:MAG: hypothetical protein QW255_05655 [Candidatus Bilamarchaeaceae archaeon]
MAHLIGAWLMHLDPSSPNSNGVEERNINNGNGAKKRNINSLKTIIKNGLLYPYVNNLSMTNNIINTMLEIFTDIEFEIKDLFGYFDVKNGKNIYSRRKTLNVSHMVSLMPNRNLDFRTSTQHEGSPVLYGIELLCGPALFRTDLDLGRLGVFYSEKISGYNNIDINEENELIKEAIKNGAVLYKDKKVLVLPYEMRMKRIEYALRSITNLRGGANMSTNYTEISPAMFIIHVGIGAGRTLREAYKLNKKYNSYIIDPNTLHRMYSNSRNIISKIYVGWDAGYPYDPRLNSLRIRNEVFSQLIKLFGEENICVGSPNRVIEQLIMDIDANKEEWLKPQLDI